MFYSLIGININNYSGAIKKKGSSADYWWLRGEWVYSTDAFWSVTSSGVGYSQIGRAHV